MKSEAVLELKQFLAGKGVEDIEYCFAIFCFYSSVDGRKEKVITGKHYDNYVNYIMPCAFVDIDDQGPIIKMFKEVFGCDDKAYIVNPEVIRIACIYYIYHNKFWNVRIPSLRKQMKDFIKVVSKVKFQDASLNERWVEYLNWKGYTQRKGNGK